MESIVEHATYLKFGHVHEVDHEENGAGLKIIAQCYDDRKCACTVKVSGFFFAETGMGNYDGGMDGDLRLGSLQDNVAQSTGLLQPDVRLVDPKEETANSIGKKNSEHSNNT